jgi:aldehyde:ferredoxin oxidoreductase
MYGMDTISCGATIAWAMNCFEKGLITKKETRGLDLNFGNSQAMVQLVEMIAKREGFGNELAEGSFRASEKIGRNTTDLVVTVKKQELPGHMPQLKPSLGLIYAVNPFGADHQSSEHDPSYSSYPAKMKQLGLVDPQPGNELNDEMVKFAFITQCFYACLDSLDICQFVFGAGWQLYNPDQLVEVVRDITGWDVTMDELLRLGERRVNMMRVFNMRENIDRSFDSLPKKLKQPLQGGKSSGLFVDFENLEKAKDHYYELAGWNIEKGLPLKEKLDSLDLSWLSDMLKLMPIS